VAGERTEVASAKRAFLGDFSEGAVEELESVRRERVIALGSLSSSLEKPTARERRGFVMSTGDTGS
jgi:hypothetical protein